jgi:hypothetical protein
MTRFRRIHRALAPRWLTLGEGDAVGMSIGIVVDAAAQRAYEGTLARFPQHCPDECLPLIGRDRLIVRGIDEAAEGYAERLVGWLDAHRGRGNPYALAEQLRAYCQADVRVRTVDARGNWYTIDRDGSRSFVLNTGSWLWDGTPAAPEWARFWVIIYPTAAGEPWSEGPDWGDVDLWGGAWGTPGYTWGSTATPGQVAAVRAIVSQWKPAGTRCEHIIIAFDDASFDPAAPEPDGTWDRQSIGDPSVARRLATARYWDGART